MKLSCWATAKSQTNFQQATTLISHRTSSLAGAARKDTFYPDLSGFFAWNSFWAPFKSQRIRWAKREEEWIARMDWKNENASVSAEAADRSSLGSCRRLSKPRAFRTGTLSPTIDSRRTLTERALHQKAPSLSKFGTPNQPRFGRAIRDAFSCTRKLFLNFIHIKLNIRTDRRSIGILRSGEECVIRVHLCYFSAAFWKRTWIDSKSIKMCDDEIAALVVDNGSGMCKAGFAGDDAPR